MIFSCLYSLYSHYLKQQQLVQLIRETTSDSRGKKRSTRRPNFENLDVAKQEDFGWYFAALADCD